MLDIDFKESNKYILDGKELKFLLDMYYRYKMHTYLYEKTFEKKEDLEDRDFQEAMIWEYEAKLEKYCREHGKVFGRWWILY